jgi:hypothetical protein
MPPFISNSDTYKFKYWQSAIDDSFAVLLLSSFNNNLCAQSEQKIAQLAEETLFWTQCRSQLQYMDHLDEDDVAAIGYARTMVAGAFAGVSEHLCMFPVDTVKTRLQVAGLPGMLVGCTRKLPGVAFVRLCRKS